MQKSAENQKRRLVLNWALRFSVSGIVLGIVFWLLPWDEFWSAIKSISLPLWVLVLILFLAGHVVAAVKWWLLTTLDADIPFPTALKAHFAGLVANLSLPGVAGGDVVRAGLVFRHSKNKTRVTIGSLADRLLDSMILLALAGGGMLYLLHDHWSANAMLAGGLGLGLCFIIFMTIILAPKFLPHLPMQNVAEKVLAVIQEFREQPKKLALCISISIVVQMLFISLSLTLALAIGVKIPIAAWFFAWPLAKVLAIAPVSISGLGIREGGLAALLTPFGANPATVVAAGLLWQSILFAGGLIGGLALIMVSKLKPETPASTSKIGQQDPQSNVSPSSHHVDQHSP
jgi:glycosyltransferase 2 family protein